MLKRVTHQALQRAVLVTIFHPLSLECRMAILKEIEAVKGLPGAGSSGNLARSASDPSLDTSPTPAAGVTLIPNAMKEAWDRLSTADNPKISLIMMYIEHILLDRVVPTSIDCTPGNETMVQHQVDEEYLASHCPAITPLRTLNDPKSDAIDMLQYLCYLPRKDYCDAQCSAAAVTQALNATSLTPPTPLLETKRSASTLSEGSGDNVKSPQNEAWSSELTMDEEGSLSASNLSTDCEAEADDAGGLSRSKISVSDPAADTSTPVGIADERHQRGHKDWGRLERSGEDDFSSPPMLKSRSRMARNDMLMPTESTMGVGLNTADQLMLPALRRLDDVLNDRLPYYPEVRLTYSVESVFNVLCTAHSHSVTAVQTAAHLVYSLSLLVASARNLALPSPAASKGNSFSSNSGHVNGSANAHTNKGGSFSGAPPAKSNSFSSVAPAERASKVFFPEGCDPSGLVHQSLLEYFEVKIREAGRNAALKLLVRLEGTLSALRVEFSDKPCHYFVTGAQAEMVLNLVREEVARLEGQKWKRCVERVSAVAPLHHLYVPV
jgi:hypothetical protein